MDAEFLKVADDAFLFYCFKCDEWSFFDRFCNNLTEPERWFSFSSTVFSKPQSGEEKTTPRVDIEDLIMIGQRQEHWSTRPLRRDNNIWTCVISAPHFYASNLKFLKKNHQNISFFHDKNLPRSKIPTAFEQRMEMEDLMSVFCCCFFWGEFLSVFLDWRRGCSVITVAEATCQKFSFDTQIIALCEPSFHAKAFFFLSRKKQEDFPWKNENKYLQGY